LNFAKRSRDWAVSPCCIYGSLLKTSRSLLISRKSLWINMLSPSCSVLDRCKEDNDAKDLREEMNRDIIYVIQLESTIGQGSYQKLWLCQILSWADILRHPVKDIHLHESYITSIFIKDRQRKEYDESSLLLISVTLRKFTLCF
jgi:hypothetical protein